MSALALAAHGEQLRLRTADEVLRALELGLVSKPEARALLGLEGDPARATPSPLIVAGGESQGVREGWYQLLIDDYAHWLLRGGRSPKSIKTWSPPLRSFGRFLSEQHVADPREVNRTHLEAWQDEVHRSRVNPHTRLVYSTALRGLLRFAELEREELGLRPGLFLRVLAPKQPEALPRPLEPKDLRRILAHFATPQKDVLYMRDRALFLCLLTSGARISEVLQMTVEHVCAGLPIVVRQKGGRDKRLVIGETAREWLQQYLRLRGRDEEPALWIQLGQGPARRRPLAPDGINLRWKELAKQLGLPRFTSHQLRHTAGTELLESGAGDTEVAELLGHRNLNMIRRYARVSETRRRDLVARLDEIAPLCPSARTTLTADRRRGDGGTTSV